ncbi:hypothetical protein BB561_002669 [Smittium simulii]|uniref:Protein HIR n=1 Tax=Smittium simulii TaxID=133385 RepID=A0A2T9YPN5_9FUNG|nr:hypothetical protein BB561_002669 [Smittium simulii]
MHVIKPDWLHHDDDKKKLTAIFSVDFDPTGTRLATAGMDNKIRLWNPIAFSDFETPSNNGKYLVSSADDMVILIWEQSFDTDFALQAGNLSQNKAFGACETAETWRPIKRLTGHESDVVDVAWAPHNQFLASCGLDNNIFIWDGQTFDKIHKITGHSEFVKGLSFDPTGELLASQSDDRTMKVWKTSDWSLESTISEPFQNSQFSTWSPDGSGVVAANAVNGSSPIVSVINRKTWKSELALVGHRAAIEAVRYNHRVFKIEEEKSNQEHKNEKDTTVSFNVDNAFVKNTSSNVETDQDRSVSIWLGSQPVPLVVVDSLFNGNIMDLSWCNIKSPSNSKNTYTSMLAACSYDGTVAILFFDQTDIGGSMVSLKEQNALTSKWSSGFRYDSASKISEAKSKLKKHKKDWGMDCNLINIVDSSDDNSVLESDSSVLINSSKSKQNLKKFDGNSEKLGSNNSLNKTNEPLSIDEPANFENITQILPTTNCNSTQLTNSSDQKITNEPEKSTAEVSNSEKSISTPEIAQVITRTTDGKKRVAPTFLRPLGGVPPIKKPNVMPQAADSAFSDTKSTGNKFYSPNLTKSISLGDANLSMHNFVNTENLTFGAKSVIEALGYIGRQLNQLSDIKADNKNAQVLLDDNQFPLIPNVNLKLKKIEPYKSHMPIETSTTRENNRIFSLTSNAVDDIILEDNTKTKKTQNSRLDENLLFPLPKVLQNLIRKSIKTDSMIICKNSVDPQTLSKVTVSSCQTADAWNYYLSSPVIALTSNEHFIAFGCSDSTLHIFLNSGLRVCPPIFVEAPISLIGCSDTFCYVISSSGFISVWDVVDLESIVSALSLKSLLRDNNHSKVQKNDKDFSLSITKVSTDSKGLPIVVLSNGFGYGYNIRMKSWMRISNPIEFLASKLNNFWSWSSVDKHIHSVENNEDSADESETDSEVGTIPSNEPDVIRLGQSSNYFKDSEKENSMKEIGSAFSGLSRKQKALYSTQLASYLQWSKYVSDMDTSEKQDSDLEIKAKNQINENIKENSKQNELNPNTDSLNAEKLISDDDNNSKFVTQETLSEKIKSMYGKHCINEITLGHIEHQLLSSIALESREEVLYWFKLYARWLAVYGTKKKIIDIFVNLLGPSNAHGLTPNVEEFTTNSKTDNKKWAPYLAGIPKRKILSMILPIISAEGNFREVSNEFSIILESISSLQK